MAVCYLAHVSVYRGCQVFSEPRKISSSEASWKTYSGSFVAHCDRSSFPFWAVIERCVCYRIVGGLHSGFDREFGGGAIRLEDCREGIKKGRDLNQTRHASPTRMNYPCGEELRLI